MKNHIKTYGSAYTPLGCMTQVSVPVIMLEIVVAFLADHAFDVENRVSP